MWGKRWHAMKREMGGNEGNDEIVRKKWIRMLQIQAKTKRKKRPMD